MKGNHDTVNAVVNDCRASLLWHELVMMFFFPNVLFFVLCVANVRLLPDDDQAAQLSDNTNRATIKQYTRVASTVSLLHIICPITSKNEGMFKLYCCYHT
jgi:hypothetical protein